MNPAGEFRVRRRIGILRSVQPSLEIDGERRRLLPCGPESLAQRRHIGDKRFIQTTVASSGTGEAPNESIHHLIPSTLVRLRIPFTGP